MASRATTPSSYPAPLIGHSQRKHRVLRQRRVLRKYRVLRLLTLLAWLAVLAGGILTYLIFFVAGPRMQAIAADAPALVHHELAIHETTYMPLSNMGTWLPRATMDIEDRRFTEHGAMDLRAMVRAAWLDLSSQRYIEGGSTIDEQLAERLLELRGIRQDQSNPLWFGLRVVTLAGQLDGTYGKQGVLELYLNDIYYGSGAYGAGAAARIFYNSTPARLDADQAAFLAGLPNLPAVFGDYPHSISARHRWQVVLAAMQRAGDLTAAQVTAFKQAGPPSLAITR